MKRKPYYRIGEIADKTGIPRSTLYDACRSGQVEVLKLGAAVYIPEREAKRLLGEPVSDDDQGGEAAR
ncbi:MAG: helix-turn-helix domain-containing protein [Acidobacteriota bacterium]